MNTWQLKRKWNNFGIENLMTYVVATMGVLWVTDYIFPEVEISRFLYFDRSLILAGQVWRMLTFMFVVSTPSPLFAIFALFFYYIMGRTLEPYWGTHRFTVFFLLGMLFLNVAGFIAGIALADYFYQFMFFAYAIINPDEQFMLFFVIPVKAKILAVIDAVFIIIEVLTSMRYGILPILLSIAASMILLIIFFREMISTRIKAIKRRRKFKHDLDHRNDE